MSSTGYPKYNLPSGGWTTDPERADRIWRRHATRTADDNRAYVRALLAERQPAFAAALEAVTTDLAGAVS